MDRWKSWIHYEDFVLFFFEARPKDLYSPQKENLKWNRIVLHCHTEEISNSTWFVDQIWIDLLHIMHDWFWKYSKELIKKCINKDKYLWSRAVKLATIFSIYNMWQSGWVWAESRLKNSTCYHLILFLNLSNEHLIRSLSFKWKLGRMMF